jgi:hypothetical protein
MVDLESLKELYQQGVLDFAGKTEENEETKYKAIKSKLEALEKVEE